MATQDLMSINTVAAKLGLSVHQLRRWELMFNLDIKRGRGQQRQYRPEDISCLERIKELVEQGWPTNQIRPQLEAEGLITPRLIGVPQQPGNPEVVLESIIGFRNFAERRFIELSKQIDELRQLVISVSLKQDMASEADTSSRLVSIEPEPKEAPKSEPEAEVKSEIVEPPPPMPEKEITLGPEVAVSTDVQPSSAKAEVEVVAEPSASPEVVTEPAPVEKPVEEAAQVPEVKSEEVAAQAPEPEFHIDEVTDQNYLTVLGKALDLIGWTDEQADEYSEKTFNVPHWDELGRSHAEKLVAHIKGQLSSGVSDTTDSSAVSESKPQQSEAEAALAQLEPTMPVVASIEQAPPAAPETESTPPQVAQPEPAAPAAPEAPPEPPTAPQEQIPETQSQLGIQPPPEPVPTPQPEPTPVAAPQPEVQPEPTAQVQPQPEPAPAQQQPATAQPVQPVVQPVTRAQPDTSTQPAQQPAAQPAQQQEEVKPKITPINWQKQDSEEGDTEQQSFDPNQ